jgi:hypothetical protein
MTMVITHANPDSSFMCVCSAACSTCAGLVGAARVAAAMIKSAHRHGAVHGAAVTARRSGNAGVVYKRVVDRAGRCDFSKRLHASCMWR